MKLSLASKVAQRILADYILSGRAKPGEALPSMRALEEQYGASVATIAHAIGQLHAQGAVRKGRAGRAFVADRPAGAPAPARQSIGLAFPAAVGAELHMRMLWGVERAARRLGFHVTVACGQDYGYESERETVSHLVRSGCRAVIINPAQRTEDQAANDYLNREFLDLPVVLIDMGLPQHRRSQVCFDNYNAGYEMTRLLLAEGHTRIAFMAIFGGPHRILWPSNRERWHGYTAALREAGIEPDPDLVWQVEPGVAATPHEQFTALLQRWSTSADPATAVLALEDQQAAGLALEAREMGVNVPEQPVITGFDNTAAQCPVRPHFLTTQPDFAHAGEKAVELAIRELRGELVPPVCYMLPVPVVRRTANAVEPVGETPLSAAARAAWVT